MTNQPRFRKVSKNVSLSQWKQTKLANFPKVKWVSSANNNFNVATSVIRYIIISTQSLCNYPFRPQGNGRTIKHPSFPVPLALRDKYFISLEKVLLFWWKSKTQHSASPFLEIIFRSRNIVAITLELLANVECCLTYLWFTMTNSEKINVKYFQLSVFFPFLSQVIVSKIRNW